MLSNLVLDNTIINITLSIPQKKKKKKLFVDFTNLLSVLV